MAFLNITSCRRDRVAKRLALVLSLVVHGGLAAGAAALATQPSTPEDEVIAVALVSDHPPPEVLMPEDLPTAAAVISPLSALAAGGTSTLAREKLASSGRPTAQSAKAPARLAEFRAAADVIDEVSETNEPVPVVPAGAEGGGEPIISASGQGTALGTGAVAASAGAAVAGLGNSQTHFGSRSLSALERRALLERYLKLIDPRIRRNFHYPRQAEALEIEGDVRIVVAVDAQGRLVRAHTTGSCPHTLLCEDAARTVRASLPFPPPPPELGGIVEVELPLTYRLE